jgi:alpha-L-fucosidase
MMIQKPVQRRVLVSSLVVGIALVAHGAHAAPLPVPDRGGVPESKLFDYGVMGPPATPAIVAAANRAVKLPTLDRPVAPTWDSLEQHYRVPSWFRDVKFALWMHWGLYAVPAHQDEWYEKHMYEDAAAWHVEHFGPHERFGYKDFIPMFRAEKFDADAWAALFKASGARLVMPTAQHHDNFALWDSRLTPYNARAMGPKRDLIGELEAAVRKQGMKFGLSNHGIENFTFINPAARIEADLAAKKADLYDPAWARFYSVADRSDAAMTRFLGDWVDRNVELIDRYRPDFLWFDNGVNLRVLDPLKLRVAAHYYDRAKQWGKEVTIGSKFVAFAPSNDDRNQVGSVLDFEQYGPRTPTGIRPGAWLQSDTISPTSWGYTEGMKLVPLPTLVTRLADVASKGGTYLLNISPKADGTIPDDQRATLLGIGRWLAANGESIYGTHPWRQFGDGSWRYTSAGKAVYAIGMPGQGTVHLPALGKQAGVVSAVTRLGQPAALRFTQDDDGLTVEGVAADPDGLPVALKITGPGQ